MGSRLIAALRAKRRARNASLLLAGAGIGAAAASMLSALAMLLASVWLHIGAAGRAGSATMLWAGLSALGAVVGLAFARRRRTDDRAVAAWLDGRLHTGELFSAALHCHERGATGAFDATVMARAESLKRASRLPRLPAAPLLIGLASLALALLPLPLPAAIVRLPSAQPRGVGPGPSKDAASPGLPGTPPSAAAAASGAASPAEISKLLFPKNARLAELTERALKEGRIDEVQGILRGAKLDVEGALRRGTSDEERKKLLEEKSALDSALLAFGDQGGGATASKPQEGGSTPPGAPRAREDGQGPDSQKAPNGNAPPPQAAPPPANGAPPAGSEPPPQGNGGGMAAPQGSPPGNARIPPGSEGGSGTGTPKDWGPVSPRSKGEAALGGKGDGSFFDYVLPGEGAKLGLGDVVASSTRSAEAAIARESVPLDYAESLAEYFRRLAALVATTGSAPEGESK